MAKNSKTQFTLNGKLIKFMPFGKHKGEDIRDVPTEYLEWFIDNIEPDCTALENIIKACEEAIDARSRCTKYLD